MDDVQGPVLRSTFLIRMFAVHCICHFLKLGFLSVWVAGEPGGLVDGGAVLVDRDCVRRLGTSHLKKDEKSICKQMVAK